MSQTSSFLKIPVEIRADIYLRIFNRWQPHNSGKLYGILYVCRQTHEEAIQVLLRDDRYFQSLPDFRQWVQRANPAFLGYVKSVSVDIECDNRSLATFRNLNNMKNWSHDPASGLERDESNTERLGNSSELSKPRSYLATVPKAMRKLYTVIRRIPALTGATTAITRAGLELVDESVTIFTVHRAFKSLSGLDKLWLLIYSRRAKTEPEYLPCWLADQQLLLEIISIACTTILREFTFFSALTPLSFVRNLENLRLLRFSGYTLSSPTDTTAILSTLKHLNSICLYRYPEHSDSDFGVDTSTYSKHVSFVPECLAAIRPLIFFEIRHSTSQIPSHFLNPAMLDALQSHHSTTLRKLWIHHDGLIPADTTASILRLISASANLVNLRLVLHTDELPVVDKAELLNSLPEALKDRPGGSGKVSIIIEESATGKKIEHNPNLRMW